MDDEEGAEGLMRSASMLAWLRTFDENSFDPDAVPDIAMADYLGGTVSVAANRPGVMCILFRFSPATTFEASSCNYCMNRIRKSPLL